MMNKESVYHDGVQLNNTAKREKHPGDFQVSDRRIVLGRFFDEMTFVPPSNDKFKYYSSVSIDELQFYNHILRDIEIMQMIE